MFLQNFNWIVLAEAAIFIYAAYAVGDALFRLFDFGLATPIKNAVYRILVGYTVFANIGLAAALFGVFTAPFIRGAVLFALLLSARSIFIHFRALGRLGPAVRSLGAAFRRESGLKVMIALWLSVNIFIVFVPITGWDALDYHLPIINDILAKGRVDFTPSIPSYHYLPVLAEVFYAVPIAIFGETGAPYVFQFLMYSVLPLTLALVYDFLRPRVADRRLALAASLLVLSLFDYQREIMHAGYIDVFVFIFAMASTLLLIEAAANRRSATGEIALSAALLGTALSMKYVAFFSLATNGLLLAILAWWQQGNPATVVVQNERSLKNYNSMLWGLARWGSLYLAIILVIAGYWYVRNTVWFGSPVYPMFSSAEFTGAVENLIMERTPQNFFLFPFARFGRWFSDPNETSSRLVPLAYFGALYLLLPLALALRRRLTIAESLLLLAAGSWMLFSFLTSHQIRFFLPAVLFLVPLLVLLADGVIAAVRAWRPWAGMLLRRLTAGTLGLLFIATFLGNFHYFQIRFLYAFGIYTEEQYIGSIGSQ